MRWSKGTLRTVVLIGFLVGAIGQRGVLPHAEGAPPEIEHLHALAFDPKILILDEATSSVDSQTEALIQDALKQLLTERTAIIIAHRLSTVKKVDRILVIHKGQVWEEGSHEELLARQGLYARLYELQYRAQEIGRTRSSVPVV